MSTPAVALHPGRHGSADDWAWSAAAGRVPVPACRSERCKKCVHCASGGGVGAFVVDGVGEGEVALAERESEAIEAIFPKTTVQTCIVHLLRHSLKYVPRKEREQVARDLKPIYTAVDADAAQEALERFDEKWGQRFPVITKAWLDAWEYVIPFLAFPEEVRRVIYTTNAIEALNRQLRKAIKTKGHFPNEDSARKLIYLAVRNATPQWTRCRNWTTALLAFKIHFGDPTA